MVRLVPPAFELCRSAGYQTREMRLWQCVALAKIAIHLRPSNQHPPAEHMLCLDSAVIKCMRRLSKSPCAEGSTLGIIVNHSQGNPDRSSRSSGTCNFRLLSIFEAVGQKRSPLCCDQLHLQNSSFAGEYESVDCLRYLEADDCPGNGADAAVIVCSQELEHSSRYGAILYPGRQRFRVSCTRQYSTVGYLRRESDPAT